MADQALPTVPLADPGGTIQDIPTEQAQDMLDNGFTKPTDQQFQQANDEELNSRIGQQAKGLLEGAANTATGGFATKAELDAGVDPADIMRRKSTLGHTIGQVLPLIAAPEIGTAGLLGGAAIGGLDMALVQAGDESSKMILDPNYAIGNALHNVGAAALLGGAFGAGSHVLGSAAKAFADTEYGKIASDFKARAQQLINNPDPVGNITNELQGADQFVHDAALHGDGGLKDQVIAKLSPDLDAAKGLEQGQALLSNVKGALAKAQAEPGIYQGARINALSDYANRLEGSLATTQDPGAIFKALNDFKKGVGSLGDWSPIEGAIQKPAASLLKGIYSEVQQGLEDTGTWGKLGKFQAATNEATSDLIAAEKQLNKFKSIGADGQRVLDSNKIQSYVNQTGKGTAEIKQGVVQSYVDALDKYAKSIGDAHNELGIESPVPPPSLQALKSTLGKPTAGSKLADYLANKGLARMAGNAAGGALGGGVGSALGAPGIGALIGQRAIGPFLSGVLPSLTEPILRMAASGAGMNDAVHLGLQAVKGQALLHSATNAIVKGGESAMLKAMLPSKEETDKLQQQVIANQKNPQRMISTSGHVGAYMPQHAAAIGAKVQQVQSYLTAKQPKPMKPNVFDAVIEPTNQQKLAYQRTLQIAEKPLSLAHHIYQGSLIPSDVADINALHPDVHQAMVEGLTKSVIEHTASGNRVPYKVQQSISLFAGQPLNSTMTPQAIQAAQAVFTQQAQQGQPGPDKNKKSTSSLSKVGDEFKTPGQARQSDKQSND